MTTTCPYCGTIAESTDEFCNTCGGKLPGSSNRLHVIDEEPVPPRTQPSRLNDNSTAKASDEQRNADKATARRIANTKASFDADNQQTRASNPISTNSATQTPMNKTLVAIVAIAAIMAIAACTITFGARFSSEPNSNSVSAPAVASSDAPASKQQELVGINTKIDYFDENGNLSRTAETDIDGHGSPLSRTTTNYDITTGEQTRVYREDYELDDNGFTTSIKATLNGTDQGWSNVNIEYDKHGRPLTETEEYTSKKYDYYPNDRVKTRIFKNDNYQEKQEYDEDGLRLKTVHEEDGKTIDSTYTWKKDDDGNPTSCTVDIVVSTSGDEKTYQRSYAVSTNEYGMIDEIRDAKTNVLRVKVQDYAMLAQGSVSSYGKQRFTSPVVDETL